MGNHSAGRRLANARIPVFAAMALTGLFIAGLVSESDKVPLYALSLPLTFLGICGVLFRVDSQKASPGLVGVLLIVGLVVGAAVTALVATRCSANASPTAFAAIIGAAWLLSSIIFNLRFSKGTRPILYRARDTIRRVRTAIAKKPLLFTGPIYLYMSLVGFLYEVALFAAAGVPASTGTDPRNLVLAVFSHPTLVFTTILCGVVSALLYLVFAAIIDSDEHGRRRWREYMSGIPSDTAYWRIHHVGARLLGLPTDGVRALRNMMVRSFFVVLVVVPLGLAVVAANYASGRAAEAPLGTLTELSSGRYANGVQPVGYTSSRLIALVTQCPAAESSDKSENGGKSPTSLHERWWAALLKLPETLGAVVGLETANTGAGANPIVLPAATEISFHLSTEASCFNGWESAKETVPRDIEHHTYAILETHPDGQTPEIHTTVEIPSDAFENIRATLEIPREALTQHIHVDVPPDAINLAVDARIHPDSLPTWRPFAFVPMTPASLASVVLVGGAPVDQETTFTVLFPPLSPFTTGAAGVTVQPATARWLAGFGDALGSCKIDRVMVVGHASQSGFGAPQHQSVWGPVIAEGAGGERSEGEEEGEQPGRNETERAMNCGLANLRARQVALLLKGGRADMDENSARMVRAFRAAKKLSVAIDGGNLRHLRQQLAEEIRNLLSENCAESPDPHVSSVGHAIDVHAWSSPDADWSWLPSAETRALNRSAHITLRGGEHLNSCPMLLGSSTLPLRVNGTSP